jgi:DNA-directed RNA polymerase specialized sigma24 family protein
LTRPEPRPPDPGSLAPPPDGGTDSDIDWELAREIAYRIALRLCRNTHLSEEVAQEAAVRMISYKGPIRDWKKFLYKVVSNASLTALNREQNRLARVTVDTSLTGNAADRELSADDRLQRKLILQGLDERFGNGTRAIVEFRMQRFKWEEISRMTGLSDRTCRERYESAWKWVSGQFAPNAAKESTHE